MLLIPHGGGLRPSCPHGDGAVYTKIDVVLSIFNLLYKQGWGWRQRTVREFLGFPAVSLPGPQFLPSLVTNLLIYKEFLEWQGSKKFFPEITLCGRETPSHVGVVAIRNDQRVS
jgi:hypothetical protein